ncbi:MAG: bifunctional 2-keto-4-hydroxyglutarate aldolase/2-keto-3-deoxy-6-phosphogluconate aldolase [Kosmotogaceae bacterium]
MDHVLKRITGTKIMAVIRAETPEKALEISEACYEGGVDIIEITYSVPHASDVIHELDKKMSDKILLGAGTVLDSETAKNAIEAGSRFIVSPTFSKRSKTLCSRYRVLYIPGIMTPNEAQKALENGCSVMKLFPAKFLGPSYIKAIKGPLPQIDIIPTGGINKDNAKEWIKAGAIAIGIGSSLVKGTKDQIKRNAKEFMKIINE